MGLQRYKTLILVITTAVALFVASPALQQLVLLPQTERISEIWLLSPNHNTAYPSNVTEGDTYRLYLDISNHLGACSYYVIEVKFRNQTQSAPNSFNHTSSQQPSMGSLTVFVADNKTTEIPLDVSFHYNVNDRNPNLLDMQDITVNGEALNANSTTIAFDTPRGGFYGNLFFELWVLDEGTNTLQYHERYVGLWLKMKT